MSNSPHMFFSLLPEARHLAVCEYVRDRAAALRGATPGASPMPVYRPAASRFLIAGLCAWVLWQPLKGGGPEATSRVVAASAVHHASDATPATAELPADRR